MENEKSKSENLDTLDGVKTKQINELHKLVMDYRESAKNWEDLYHMACERSVFWREKLEDLEREVKINQELIKLEGK